VEASQGQFDPAIPNSIVRGILLAAADQNNAAPAGAKSGSPFLHVRADIRAFDTLERQGVRFFQQGIAVVWTTKIEIFQRLRVLSAHASGKFARFFEFGIAVSSG
jgi:hypothetical protein